MVMMDKADRMFQPRKPQYEPEKPSPSGCPFDAMFATNHLIPSQYSPTCTKIMSALRYWIPVRARQMDRKIAPKYHHRMVTGRPVKLRFGRSGTRVHDTIHLQYMTMTHGTGMTNNRPMNNTSVRQMKSQIPKSTESDPPAGAPLPKTAPASGTTGGPEVPESRPGIFPAFCQPAMPSVQTSVSAVTIPLAMNSCS